MADGWTTGGVDVVGAAGPLPGQSHDRSHDITCTHPFLGGWGGGGVYSLNLCTNLSNVRLEMLNHV